MVFGQAYQANFNKETGVLVSYDEGLRILSKEDIGKKFIKSAFFAIADKESISQELVYSGCSGNMIFIKYREYYKVSFARDAFTQDLQFDLTKGNIIRFKDMTIKVHNANNEYIEFEIQNL